MNSVVDGFQIILGTFMVHIAATLSLIFFIRLVEYDDQDERNKQVKWIYAGLIILHFSFAAIKWHATYRGGFWWDKMVILITVLCFLACYFMGDWIFRKPEYTDDVPTLRQQKFELWLYFELLMFISYIAGGALYILIYKIKQPCLYIEPPALLLISKGKYFLDFTCTHMLTIDMSNTIFVPALSLFCLSFHEEAGSKVIRNLGIMGIC